MDASYAVRDGWLVLRLAQLRAAEVAAARDLAFAADGSGFVRCFAPVAAEEARRIGERFCATGPSRERRQAAVPAWRAVRQRRWFPDASRCARKMHI